MPNRDGTGPAGTGPASGWGAGPCGDDQPGMGRFGGRRRGGRGRGMGWRGIGAPITPDQERSWLETQAQNLQNALRSINERLETLKKS